MKKIAWVTDSTIYLTEELKQNPDIYVVPLTIIFGNKIYEDGVTINQEQLYEKMKENATLPTTSQPPLGTFIELYERLKKEYEIVMLLHVSSKLSGTYSCSVQAAELTGIRYYAVDTEVTTAAMTFLLEEGLYMEQQGMEAKDIVKRLRKIIPALEDYILIGSLQQLHRGGRLSNAQFLLGTLLNIKPILRIQNGFIEVFEKVRSEKKAMRLIMEKCADALSKYEIRKFAIVHGNREEDANKWKQMLLNMNKNLHVRIVPITSTLSVHAGEGTLAILWYNTLLEA
jgi:DegV family protein with EDD domain